MSEFTASGPSPRMRRSPRSGGSPIVTTVIAGSTAGTSISSRGFYLAFMIPFRFA